MQKGSKLDYFWFKENGEYQGKYSQLITEFLANGFESNCDDYDIRNEYGTIRMESDCQNQKHHQIKTIYPWSK